MQKIKYLEGLRGVAALMVLFHHLQSTCFITYEDKLNSIIYGWKVFGVVKLFITDMLFKFSDGELAVWVFWVLSSYVISILFFKKGENYDKVIIGYFSKRYFRLAIPVFASIMLAYVLLQCGLMHNHELATKLGPAYDGRWLASFYNFKPDVFSAIWQGIYSTFFNFNIKTSYNTVVWTIQNELLGSLFTFSIFGIIRHNARRFLLYIAILLVVIQLNILWLAAFIIGHVLADYDFSDSRHSIILWLKKAEQFLHKYTLVVFMASIVFIVCSDQIMWLVKIPMRFHQFLLGVFIVYVCLRNQFYKNIFSAKIPFWLGKISYSLYLIHLPIVCALTTYLVLQNNTLQGKIIASLVTIAVVLAGAYVFRKYIDSKGVVLANKVGDYFKQYTD